MAEGAAVAAPGQRLRPQDVAALAASGRGETACVKQPRIFIVIATLKFSGALSLWQLAIKPGPPMGAGKIWLVPLLRPSWQSRGRDGVRAPLCLAGRAAASGLIEIPEDVQAVREGDSIAFIPFPNFGIFA